MDRKSFFTTGLCSCFSACMLPLRSFGISAAEDEPRPKTCQERYEFAQIYVKRLMDVLERKVDEKTRVDIVRSMGEVCAKGAYGEMLPENQRIGLEELINRMGGRKEDGMFYWEYTGSPWTGLKIADGYCLCPLTEKGPEGLSGLYCECSVGYVTYMLKRVTGTPVEVELLESLKRGGKGCRFRISENP